MSDRVRVGIIYPGGAQAEEEYYEFAERRGDLTIFLVISRIPEGGGHGIRDLLETGSISNLVEAARRLTRLHPDAVMWACTSGSFVVGRRGAEEQIAAIETTVGSPTSSTSLAFVHALEQLGISKVAIAATYPREAASKFKDFLSEFQIETLNLKFLGAESGYAASELSAERVIRLAREVNSEEAQAILIPDTAFPSLEIIRPLEELLGKTVLTANQVTLWESLRLSGRKDDLSDFRRTTIQT